MEILKNNILNVGASISLVYVKNDSIHTIIKTVKVFIRTACALEEFQTYIQIGRSVSYIFRIFYEHCHIPRITFCNN